MTTVNVTHLFYLSVKSLRLATGLLFYCWYYFTLLYEERTIIHRCHWYKLNVSRHSEKISFSFNFIDRRPINKTRRFGRRIHFRLQEGKTNLTVGPLRMR